MKSKPFEITKEQCFGCGACVAVCPQSCLEMTADSEGFLYAQYNQDIALCTDCHCCEKACPAMGGSHSCFNRIDDSGEHVFAGWNLDASVRKSSSSGGVFSVFAAKVLARGGVVVGAAFDQRLFVRHILINKSEDIAKLRGSKYVQSVVSTELYKTIRDTLNKGREVLFSGTPCQVAGLRLFLKKSYSTLVCLDLVCAGVPSPDFFQRYLKYLSCKRRMGDLKDVIFRYKQIGWKRFKLKLFYQTGAIQIVHIDDDPYFHAFLNAMSLRPSCYSCSFSRKTRVGDITIADFWGVGKRYPEYDVDDKGTSLILVNTKKGRDLLESVKDKLFLGNACFEAAVAGNPRLTCPVPIPSGRDVFYEDLQLIGFSDLISKYKLRRPVLIVRKFHSVICRLKKMMNIVAQLMTRNI